MSCLVKIKAAREKLSVSEKKLADFILSNAALIRDYSSQHLAGRVGVSQSSVVKFSQKLGYRGFTDLKLAIHENVVEQSAADKAFNTDSSVDSENISIAQSLLRDKSEVLLTTDALNDEQVLKDVVDVLRRSKRIQIVAIGEASLVARDFSHKLQFLGKPANAEPDAYVQLSAVELLGNEDVVFLISSDGHTRMMLHLARQAKKVGACVITLTNFSANPLNALTKFKLYSVAQNGLKGFPLVHTTASQQHVIDILCSMMIGPDGKSGAIFTRSRKIVDFLNES